MRLRWRGNRKGDKDWSLLAGVQVGCCVFKVLFHPKDWGFEWLPSKIGYVNLGFISFYWTALKDLPENKEVAKVVFETG